MDHNFQLDCDRVLRDIVWPQRYDYVDPCYALDVAIMFQDSEPKRLRKEVKKQR